LGTGHIAEQKEDALNNDNYHHYITTAVKFNKKIIATRMWANAQRDGLPNIGGALCSTPQSLADAHY